VGSHVGLGAAELAAGVKAFKGIKRRLEVVGIRRDVTVLDDFAHHPTAVHETLAALRTGYPERRVWAVFEPRSASSCRRVFQQDFAGAFGAADEVVIAGVFRSSLPESERLSAEQLVDDLRRKGQRARYIPAVDDIVRTIVDEHRAGDVVVLMSNGGFGGIHQKLLQALA
jgi:UDP-N-acetylmuramate: L-alanyl-gamma-D-glutamyl-meso-diaminopimelate ligase